MEDEKRSDLEPMEIIRPKSFISLALSENGDVSSMRLMLFILVVLFGPSFVGIWVHVGYMTTTIPEIPATVMGFLSILLGAKVAQKVVENK